MILGVFAACEFASIHQAFGMLHAFSASTQSSKPQIILQSYHALRGATRNWGGRKVGNHQPCKKPRELRRRDISLFIRGKRIECGNQSTKHGENACWTKAGPEAMAARLPIVTTPVGALPEIFSDKTNGFFVRPGDHRQLADRLIRLTEDADLRAEIGQRNSEYAMADFDIDVIAQTLGDIFDDVLWLDR